MHENHVSVQGTHLPRDIERTGSLLVKRGKTPDPPPPRQEPL